MDVHVISKSDNNVHATFILDEKPGDLAPSSIRVRTFLISLTSNNLSYARLGVFMQWWDAYPVPQNSPSPYNDPALWGIVPAWGYAYVLSSTTSIQEGELLWGFWPTASLPFDLQLTPHTLKDHWLETTPHRGALNQVYNTYQSAYSPSFPAKANIEELAWNTLFKPVWSTGRDLNCHVFPGKNGIKPIHPFGTGVWTKEDADLSNAVVISLSASSKTGRCFAWNLSKRGEGEGPLGFLQVTSVPGVLKEASKELKFPFPEMAIDYDPRDLMKISDGSDGFKAKKVVFVDFGARAHTLDRIINFIKEKPGGSDVQFLIVQVGSEQKIYTPEEMQNSRAAMTRLNKYQFFAPGIRVAVLDSDERDANLENTSMLWGKWQDEREKVTPGMKIVWGDGVVGELGIEGGWTKLCQGKVASDEGMVYNI